MSLLEKFGFAIGVCLGVVLYGPRRVLQVELRREVVTYDARDAEHGPVRVVVTANRVTGRMTRTLYARDP